MKSFFLLLFVFLALATFAAKPRIIVLTDIGGDPDDEESMVRFLLYSNEFDIEGLIATGRVVRDDRPVLLPELIKERIKAYGEVRDNLLLHESGYPTVEYLLDKVKTGYNIPKMMWDPKSRKLTNYPFEKKIGPGKDSEGSQWIIHIVDQPDPRPVWITIWGTSSDLAQALWRIKKERTPVELAAFVSKLRVFAIMKQDLTNDWILENFPDLFMIQTTGSEMGMYEEGDLSYYSEAWVNENVRQNHGPLGKLYSQRPFKLVYIEGDSPSFLYLIPNGFSDPMNPIWGTWGGRFKASGSHYFDIGDYTPEGKSLNEAKLTVAQWRPQFQNDFEARLDWCVKSFEEANHNPVASFNGDMGKDIVYFNVSSGAKVKLNANGSSDPDEDDISYKWIYMPEPGTYKGELAIRNDQSFNAFFIAPVVSTPETIHVILTAKDDGKPNLYSYRRIIITVNSNSKNGKSEKCLIK